MRIGGGYSLILHFVTKYLINNDIFVLILIGAFKYFDIQIHSKEEHKNYTKYTLIKVNMIQF